MKIEEVLAQVDELKPNQYDDTIKIDWLSKFDKQIYNQVIATHEGCSIDEFNGYGLADMAQELLVDDAYAGLYVDYVFSMIDYNNQEYDKYANSAAMFESKFADYVKWYNRTHKPLHKQYRF